MAAKQSMDLEHASLMNPHVVLTYISLRLTRREQATNDAKGSTAD